MSVLDQNLQAFLAKSNPALSEIAQGITQLDSESDSNASQLVQLNQQLVAEIANMQMSLSEKEALLRETSTRRLLPNNLPDSGRFINGSTNGISNALYGTGLPGNNFHNFDTGELFSGIQPGCNYFNAGAHKYDTIADGGDNISSGANAIDFIRNGLAKDAAALEALRYTIGFNILGINCTALGPNTIVEDGITYTLATTNAITCAPQTTIAYWMRTNSANSRVIVNSTAIDGVEHPESEFIPSTDPNAPADWSSRLKRHVITQPDGWQHNLLQTHSYTRFGSDRKPKAHGYNNALPGIWMTPGSQLFVVLPYWANGWVDIHPDDHTCPLPAYNVGLFP